MTTLQRLRAHVPEYLIEAWALGTFMVAAAGVGVLLDSATWLPRALASPVAQRALSGVAMGVTAILLIRSAWGQRSGAHLNPAVTLTYLGLGRVHRVDAVAYVLAQFVGGAAGIGLAWFTFGEALASPPVAFVSTRPGPAGDGIAFVAECAISCVLMGSVLWCSNQPRRAAATPFVAGALVALYITFEAPLSGMSMNPARSFASAWPTRNWQDLWIYFTAPPLGMALAAFAYTWRGGLPHCAKLLHPDDQRCIHCGFEPPSTSLPAGVTRHAE